MTSGALARAPGPRARLNPGARPPQDLRRAGFIVSSSGEGCGGLLTAESLCTLKLAQTGEQTGAEEPFRGLWL